MHIRSHTFCLLLCLVLLILGNITARAQYVAKIKAGSVRVYNTRNTAEINSPRPPL